MKTQILSLSLIAALSVFSCNKTVQPETTTAQPIKKDSGETVAYGKYLVTITGCNDCHSPKKMGLKGPELIPELLLSGYQSNRAIPKFDETRAKVGFAQMNEDMTAAAGPWGISFAANLTPHPTGLGNWNVEQFKKAVMHGKSKGMDNGRMLLPPMPWFNYTAMKDEDAEAIFAYLQSLKPVENVVPAPVQFK